MSEMASALDRARERLKGEGPASSPDDVLSPREVAALLQLNEQTVRIMARRRALPAIRVGRHWRFRRSSIDGWLAEQERSAR